MTFEQLLAQNPMLPNPAYPFAPTVGTYTFSMPPFLQPWEYNGWEKETMAWKKTCYISAQLIPNSALHITGPDATRFLSYYTTSGYDNFIVGQIKHTIVPDEQGRVQQHGMVMKYDENEYVVYAIGYWLQYYYERNKEKYDINIDDIGMLDFNYQCGGPRVLEMLEDACEEDLHDIGFMRFRTAHINGKPVQIMRFGMAGTLAYEVHGNMADSQELYTKVYECGKKYGVERLGWLSYACNHPENGFPQEGYHFSTSSIENDDFLKWLEEIGLDPEAWPRGANYAGSSGTDDMSKRLRNPVWLNWRNCIKLTNHEFIGKEAIAKELANPTMKTVTLVWNVDDIVAAFRTLFDRNEESCRIFNFPMDQVAKGTNTTLNQDDVLNEADEVIGWSSGRIYSNYSKDMFSVTTLKTEYAELGTEVYVLWGEPGKRQMKIRAIVSKFPHLDMPQNKDYDTNNVPKRYAAKEKEIFYNITAQAE